MFYEVAKQVPVRISVLEIRLKLYLPLRTTLGLAEPQQCLYLAIIMFYGNMYACKTQVSHWMDLFGDVRECHVWLQFSIIPAGGESPNESQRF